MEFVGVVASGITIWDLVVRAKHFCDKVKCAPDKWIRYCQELENLAHVQVVLNDMVNTSDAIKRRKIEVEGGEPEFLVKFMADRIETIRKEAEGILDRYDRLKKQSHRSRKARVWKWFGLNMTAYKFVLDDQDIHHLIEAVEHAKTCLQSLLCLLHLESLDYWQQQTQNDLRSIHGNMRKHAEALETLHKDKNLGQLTLQIVQEEGPLSYDQTQNRSSLSLRSSIRESMGSSKIGQKLKKGRKKAKNLFSTISSTSKIGHGRAHSYAGPAKATGKKAEETKYEHGLEAHADMHDPEYEHPNSDTDDEAVDDDQFSSLGCSGTMTQGRDPELEYDLIYRDNKLLTIDTNTEEYKALVSGNRGATRHPTTIRLHDAFKPMSDEEWTSCVESNPGQLAAILSSTVCSDTETVDGEILEETCGGNLEPADEEGLELTDKGAIEASPEERPQVIKETTLGNPDERTVDNTRNTTPKIPDGGVPEATNGEDPEAVNDRAEPTGESTVVDINMCPPDATNKKRVGAQDEGASKITEEVNPDATYEASVEVAAIETVRGISESTIEATNKTASDGRPEDIDEITFDPIDEATLKATDEEGSEVTGDVTLITIDFERRSVAFVDATVDLDDVSDTEEETFPSHPAQDDDTRAFVLIKGINDDSDGDDVPAEVPFDVLVEFLKLIDKYSLQEPYLTRSRSWTNALLPSIPTTLDQDAIAWLWVLWRLRIRGEFKKLSGIVQKQAECRIDEDTNVYGIELPECIVEAIDRRRVSALCTVRDRVGSIIEQYRQDNDDWIFDN
ncbi:Hypothetical protein NCS54_01389800 [Fusarium falciforme]|uniref:Hypothetical protein n=1 Tax=Fusarium falciforme TaxID=195108 RepID=UPI002300BD0A|nr:Hypothetical protein NCS54_01389800 [Fusarium falciforme]WAO96231.1 Hypothetical protein NCS54_01389800 [Fusarium falciforme]